MAELQTCDECGRSGTTVRDLGLRRPLALCEGCMAGAVRAWTGTPPRTLTRGELEAAAGAGTDRRFVRRRLAVMGEEGAGGTA